MNTLRIIITGSRHYTDSERVEKEIDSLIDKHCEENDLVVQEDIYPGDNENDILLSRNITIIHGDASGADLIAEDHAIDMGYSIESYPAQWDRYGKSAGPKRNQLMINEGADYVLAFPLDDSKGTWHCISCAKKAEIPVIVVEK